MKLKVSKWEAKAGNELAADGLIRINPNKPEFGSLMLIAVVASLSNGFMNVKNKVGFIVGRVEELKSLIANFGLKEGDDYSAKVSPSRIVTLEKVESEVPENQGYREKINPQTNETLTRDGEKIFWKTEVVAEGSDIQDVLITHDRDETGSGDEAKREFSGAATATKK